MMSLLREKESVRLEFKEARSDLPGSLFETICAMLNYEGGEILLGVNDAGEITGIEPEQVNRMIVDLAALSNNPTKITPTFILSPHKHFVDEKWIIHLQVPASSQVHKTSNFIYKRSGDGDFKVTEPQQIAEIFNQKRAHYTENIVYPELKFEDFNPALFSKVRSLIRSNNPDHPWLILDDKRLLTTAGLWKKDFHTGLEGYTLAAALIFGKDDTINQILPHYKIDALVRINNKDRYDDRNYIQTNLVEAYEQLMSFVEKHLPDKFYMQEDQRISLRTAIFREVAANIIVHREYTNAYPCTFIIGNNYVETENANNPHGEGLIDPDRFTPFPKNPVIAKFFIQLGRVDELGSGVLNVNRLTNRYAGNRLPIFIEGITFKTKIPIPAGKTEGVNEGVNEGVFEGVNKFSLREPEARYYTVQGDLRLLSTLICRLLEVEEDKTEDFSESMKFEMTQLTFLVIKNEGLRSDKIASLMGKSRATVERHIKRLKALNVIRFVGPPKTGGYYTTEFFENRLIETDN
ncbi:AAA family ATPase [Dyadobacter luticola]|uniref:AAA family ATPase n=1 Tax=Dyadobacter luticola TaxID=1979387 RepID=A0A5R9L6L4_9BACT|nr:AAA family ATPase [Dyadobacter luticola]